MIGSLINVSSNKHMIAFAPNFIHSLDATHMMMTALAMRKSVVPLDSLQVLRYNCIVSYAIGIRGAICGSAYCMAYDCLT